MQADSQTVSRKDRKTNRQTEIYRHTSRQSVRHITPKQSYIHMYVCMFWCYMGRQTYIEMQKDRHTEERIDRQAGRQGKADKRMRFDA